MDLGDALQAVGRSRLVRRGLFLTTSFVILVVLFYAEENHRGRTVWEGCQARLLRKGIQLDWHKLAPAEVADDENFAKTPFFAALFEYAPGTYTPRDLNAYNLVAGFAQFEEPYAEARRTTEVVPAMSLGLRINLAEVLRMVHKSKQRGSSKTSPAKAESSGERRETAVALLGALEQFRPVLDELQAASARPQSRFALNYAEQYPWGVAQPHLPVLERVSRVLAWRGAAELAADNAPAAAQDVELILDLAATIRSEPFRNSFFSRNAMLDNAKQVIWEGLADHLWSTNQLSDLESHLARISLRNLQPQVQLDRASGNCVFELVQKEPAIVKGWRFGPSLSEKARGFVLRNMPAGWMYLEQTAYQNRFDQCAAPAFDLEAERVHPQKIQQATQPSFALGHHRLLADLILQSTRFLCSRAALAQTEVNQSIIACALERYRLAHDQFPATLEELRSNGTFSLPLDVITGEPMKYHRTPDGQFVLYSVGWNEKDDGGKTVADPQTKAPNPDQGDWVWPVYPKPE
jgi:hypothetical protein